MNSAGYTLIELLVVIAIIGLVTAFAAPATVATVDGARLRADTRSLVSELRSLQRYAAAEGKAFVVTADPSGGLSVPDGVFVLANGSRASVTGPANAITFYADGTASGGRVRLELGDRHTDVGVAWLTGTIHVEDAP